ncbi:MAG TPA: M13 family metallopeptidase [Steroidobacteraceae bacterium]|nr:M13 family metallopeptidase [Steroidobacteraceae bacterium]
MIRSSSFVLAGAAAFLTGLALAHSAPSDTLTTPRSGLDVAAIDRSVVPGDDFFRYANGAWLKATEIPPDRSVWGNGAQLVELTSKRTADLIREAAASAAPGSEARKVGDYYASYLDEATIDAKGATPLAQPLKQIDAIKDRAGLARALGATLRADVDVLNNTNLETENLFGLWVAQDLDDPTRYTPFLLQGGLTMPDRDYYLDPSPKMAEIREQYQAHIAAVLGLARIEDAKEKATAIYELERRIAEVHSSREASEDVLKGNNHWRAAEFPKRAPGLDWKAFFAGAQLAHQDVFVVWQPSAVTGIAALTASVPLATWKDWLRFHLIEQRSPYLAKPFAEEHFAFHQRVLSGTPQQQARWKLAVAATNIALGDAVGQLYVKRYFPASEKARAEAMVRELVQAFAVRIDRLDWMAPQTRAQAKEKLAALKVGVGYPDHWRSYAGLEVRAGDAYGNAERTELFEYRWNLAKLGRPVDRSEWVMTPQTVNAVNLPAMNALNFPAAILQPPYFDPTRDPVMDYGATGAVIGHEVSHSFDNQGALFDATGRLRNWWTEADFKHFEAAGKRLAEQFDQYHPFPDVAVHGQQTLAENIADVAGLSVAHDAWRSTLEGKPAASADGFSGEQLFFLSFAQSWQTKIREAALRRRIVTDGHAPAEYRADTVRNLDPWYDAFKVQPPQKLYLTPAERVRVW